MGLDIVEMVMAVEKELHVRLPDEELGRIRTVGELYDCVVKHLDATDVPEQGSRYEGKLWERYLDVIERESGARRDRLRPAAAFVEDLRLD